LDDLEKSRRWTEYAAFVQKVFRKYELGFQPNTDFTYDFETGIILWEPSMS